MIPSQEIVHAGTPGLNPLCGSEDYGNGSLVNTVHYPENWALVTCLHCHRLCPCLCHDNYGGAHPNQRCLCNGGKGFNYL